MFATEQDVRGVKLGTEPTLKTMPGFVATAIRLPCRAQLAASFEITFSNAETEAQFARTVAGMPKTDRVRQLLYSVPVHTKILAAPRA